MGKRFRIQQVCLVFLGSDFDILILIPLNYFGCQMKMNLSYAIKLMTFCTKDSIHPRNNSARF